jgi:hypothetical protein
VDFQFGLNKSCVQASCVVTDGSFASGHDYYPTGLFKKRLPLGAMHQQLAEGFKYILAGIF